MNRFGGKTFVVTGASSGIGAARVRRPISVGANAAGIHMSRVGVDALALDLDGTERVLQLVLNVSGRTAVDACIATARKQFGALREANRLPHVASKFGVTVSRARWARSSAPTASASTRSGRE